MTLNSNLMVSKLDSGGISKNDFGLLKNDLKLEPKPKFDAKIIIGSEVSNLDFGEQFSNRNFGQKSKFQIWAAFSKIIFFQFSAI